MAGLEENVESISPSEGEIIRGNNEDTEGKGDLDGESGERLKLDEEEEFVKKVVDPRKPTEEEIKRQGNGAFAIQRLVSSMHRGKK